MKKLILVTCLVFAGCATLSHRNYAEYGADVAAKVRVVFLNDLNQGILGSGTIIGKQGYVLTAYHVAKHAEAPMTVIQIKTYDEEVNTCEIAKTDHARDLALLYCPDLEGYQGVKKIAPALPRLGDFIFGVTSPYGLPLVYTEGRVSLLASGKGKYWINMLSGPGASGGGLFNADYELAGVVQMGISGPFDFFGHMVISANSLQISRFLEGVKWK